MEKNEVPSLEQDVQEMKKASENMGEFKMAPIPEKKGWLATLKEKFSRKPEPDDSKLTPEQDLQKMREMQASSDKYWKEKQAQNEARSGSFGATAENNTTVRGTEFDTINKFGAPEGYTPQVAGAQEAVSPLPFEEADKSSTSSEKPINSLLDADALSQNNSTTAETETISIPTPESRAQVSEPILKPDDTGFVEAKTEPVAGLPFDSLDASVASEVPAPAAEISQTVTKTQERSYADMVNGVVNMPQAGSEAKAETPKNVIPFPPQTRDTNRAA